MKSTLLVLGLLCIGSVFATDSSKEVQQKLEAKGVMGSVHEAFVQVLPYVYSNVDSIETLKKDSRKKKDLLKNLDDLSAAFQSAKHVEYLQRPGFRPSLDTMNTHLIDTKNAVTYNNFPYAQRRLTALTSLCISCHTQLSNKGSEDAFGSLANKSTREKFDSDYAYGNYLFLLRDFDTSEKYLTSALDKALAEGRTHELYSTLRRIISIHTKLNFNFEKAKNFTAKYENEKKMPKIAKEMTHAWNKSLQEWKSFDVNNVKDISKLIQEYLKPMEEMNELVGDSRNDITLLITSGVLSKYLNDHPQTELTPEILYWLSVAERKLGETYYFTLSDLYLQDCVKLYSKSPYAKKCYGLYEDGIERIYTGSGGLDIPSGEKSALKKLKSYLK